MAYLKKWTAVAAGGAALSLAGVIGVGSGFAGAAPSNDPHEAFGRHGVTRRGPVQARHVPASSSTEPTTARSTFAAGNTFTAAFDGDSGTWVQNKQDRGNGIHRRHLTQPEAASSPDMSTTPALDISTAGKPGHWACPGFGSCGTFYIASRSRAATSQAHGDVFARSGVDLRPPDRSFPVPTFGPGRLLQRQHHHRLGQHLHQHAERQRLGRLGPRWERLRVPSRRHRLGHRLPGVGKVNHTGTAVGTIRQAGQLGLPRHRDEREPSSSAEHHTS